METNQSLFSAINKLYPQTTLQNILQNILCILYTHYEMEHLISTFADCSVKKNRYV